MLGYALSGMLLIALAVVNHYRGVNKQKLEAIAGQALSHKQICHDLDLLLHLRAVGTSPKEILSIFLKDSSPDYTTVVQKNYKYLRVRVEARGANYELIAIKLEQQLTQLKASGANELVTTISLYTPVG